MPITVAGVGTRDAILVLLLGRIGISRQGSVALSSLVLAVFVANCVVFYLISAALGGPGAPQAPVEPSPSPNEAQQA